MKTIKQVEKEISDIEKDIKDNLVEMKNQTLKRLKKKIEFLKQMIRYLETTPNPTFIKSEVERLKTQIELTEQKYSHWSLTAPKDIDPKKLPVLFKSQTGIAKMQKQLKTMIYLK